MAITLADFNKIWASSSPLTPYSFSDDNYNEGWNFIGQIPPSRQMWDFLQKNNDEKMQYLANNYLPLSGGTMTGAIKISGYLAGNINNSSDVRIVGGTNSSNGASLDLYGKDHSTAAGRFVLAANNGTNSKYLVGRPDGTFTWDGNNILTASNYNTYALPLSGGTMTGNISSSVSDFRILKNGDSGNASIYGGQGYQRGAHGVFNGIGNTAAPGQFILVAVSSDGNTRPELVGKPDGTLTWDGKSIPQRAYGIQLEGSGDGSTYTFNINKNGAIIFAKRGDDSSCHMVDMWSAGSVAMFSSGTDPITITKSSASNEVTITNTNNSAVAIKIINGDEL